MMGALLGMVIGVGAGAAFFAGLWWTVQRIVTSRHPARWFAASAAIRGGLVLAGFWMALRIGTVALLAALAAFLAVRTAAVRFVGRPEPAFGRADRFEE